MLPFKLYSYLASGGFAIMDETSRLIISLGEGYPLNAFSSEVL
jgi:hypothetical protein